MRRQAGHGGLHILAGKNRIPAQDLSRAAQPLSRLPSAGAATGTKRCNIWAVLSASRPGRGASSEPYLHLSHRLTLEQGHMGAAGQQEVRP